MGGKKKNLANKLAKMSDDERARYMQHRADIEEEARRRKEQLISTFMKNKLKREEAFARLNVAKINQYWHQVLRKAKCKEMKDEAEHIRKWIERTLDLKNRKIDNLIQELDEAEEQYCTNLQAHLDYIDNVIETHLENVDKLNKLYEDDRDNLIDYAEYEKDDFLTKATSDLEYLKTVSYAQSSKALKKIKNEYEEHNVLKEEMICEYKNELAEMVDNKERISSAIWKNISTVLRSYVQQTDKNRAHLAELTELDAKSAIEISISQERINTEELKYEKMKLQKVTMKTVRTNLIKELQYKIKYITKLLLKNRLFLTKKLQRDDKNLRYMTDASNKIINFMQNFQSKGEQILFLIQTCSKLETQPEKLHKRIKWDKIYNEEDDSFDEDPKNGTQKIQGEPTNILDEEIQEIIEEESVKEDDNSFPKNIEVALTKELEKRSVLIKDKPARVKSVTLPKLEKIQKQTLTMSSRHLSFEGFSSRTPEILFEKVSQPYKDKTRKLRSKSCHSIQSNISDMQILSLPSTGRPKTGVDSKKLLSFRSLGSEITRSSAKDKTIKEITIKNSNIRIRKTKSAFSTSFIPTPKINEDEEEISEILIENPAENLKFMKKTFESLNKLENLWESYNLVYLNLKEIKEEKKILEDENKNLRGMIRSILEAAMLDKTAATNSRISTRVGSRHQGSVLKTIDGLA